MAKGKKAEQRRQKARGLDRETYVDFMAGVAEKKQELDDASMINAAGWKRADALGIHADVARLCAKLDRYEPTKRNDWLRAFDTYRPWYDDWSAQPDLWDDRPAESATADQDRGGADDEAGLDLDRSEPAAKAEPLPDTVAVLKEQEEADRVDETPAEATEELAEAGFTFAAGKGAGERGEAAETNPHPEHTPSHGIWARGHAQGLRNAEAGNTGEGEGAVAQIGTRRGRRAAADTPAAVH